ncbi:GntR family transcriptional regulator [Nocardiopsis salina]|uniref:GntR family transcriptional regulator n=1 Tax=Nocardiopsis salina TaxID=245836 RepID=UPI001EF9FB60|nr:GntR family transcriptional regulator [Nocardiopsis salina]
MTRSEDEAPRGRRSTEEVYDRLRTLILENQIAPGVRLNIDAIARDFGVSQTPIREAIRQLEGDQLVVKSPGKGYRTTSLLDLGQLRDLFEFRLLVEVWAARTAAVNRLSNPARMVGEEITDFESSMVGSGDIRHELVLHDVRFHGHILAALGNEVIRKAYEQTHSHLHTFRLYPADTDGRTTVSEHRRIRDAIERCDPGGAEEAMRDHLTAAFDRFAQAFEEHGPQPRSAAVPRMYPVDATPAAPQGW